MKSRVRYSPHPFLSNGGRTIQTALSGLLLLLLFIGPVYGQFQVLETEDVRLLYYGQAHTYLVEHIARTFENAMQLARNQFGYVPSEKITLLVYDIRDTMNGSATALPKNIIMIAISPPRQVFETLPATERMSYLINHELAHVLSFDRAAGAENFFRTLFQGKVNPTSDNPLSMIYCYLTIPRILAPVWYHEGIAVFMETWRMGGVGRLFSGYDEMFFRTMILEKRDIADRLSLESAVSKQDFHERGVPYLFGTRFFGYLGMRYGPEKILQWVNRTPGSKSYFADQFREVYGLSLDDAWKQWAAWEENFQEANLTRIGGRPVTVGRPLARQALGSVSRAYYDPATRELYMGVNYPGQVAHLAAMNTDTGAMRRIIDVKGPATHVVCSLAYDPSSQTLFYTTDNNDWRDLRSVHTMSGHSQTLMKDARIGDIALHPLDHSLWGVRHDSGFSTLVRIPPPYTEWNQVHTWPYGTDGFDLSLSPDGKRLVLVLSRLNGQQSLVLMETEKALRGDASFQTVTDFDDSTPANFSFSPDGKQLYGSSFYSGVPNIYRHTLDTGVTEPLTNADTGFLRPIPFQPGTLIAFRYTGSGLVPMLIDDRPLTGIDSIRFLGQDIVDRHPQVKKWGAGSPAAIDLASRTRKKGDFHWYQNFGLNCLYPVVEGYKDSPAFGLRLQLANPIQWNRLDLSLSFSPNRDFALKEKIHGRVEYAYWDWKAYAAFNHADFYDLFGPTKTSRKGYSFGGQYQKYLIYDEPNRYLDYTLYTDAYTGLDRLPDNQNVDAVYDRLLSFGARVTYKNFRRSLGAVEEEKGYQWQLIAGNYLVNGKLYPRLLARYDYGLQLPLAHSSLWFRQAAGKSMGDRNNPFANYYFGGFGNNWIDHLEEKRYREYRRFPGKEIDEIGGNHFARVMVEWALPQIVFRRAGLPFAYLNWIKPFVFASGLSTDFTDGHLRRNLSNVGAQVDFRTVVLSNYHFTLSAGVAKAYEKHHIPSQEFMISLKIQ